VIARLLHDKPGILATGGGAYMDDATRAGMKELAFTIWLKAPIDILLGRVRKRQEHDQSRPLLNTDDMRGTLEKLSAIREPVYALADMVLESGDEPHAVLLELFTDHGVSGKHASRPELDKALAARGTSGLDILVNNAGVGVQGDVENTTEADFDLVFATNVKGLLFVSQHAVPRIRDGGRVINLSSMVGHNAYPGAIAYAATKAAVDSMTMSMALGLGPRKITVNAVAPGATDTDFIAFIMDNEAIVSHLKAQTALGEIGKPRDIAALVAFLASDDAGWITGERIRASGGMHL